MTGQVTPESERSFGNVINRNRLKPVSLWNSSEWKSEQSELPSRHEITEDDNDSFIVFGSPSRDVSEAVSERYEAIEEVEAKNGVKLDSAITMATDTSASTTTDITDVDKTNSPKRPNKLSLKTNDVTSASALNSSRMYLFIQMQLCKKESLKDWLKDNVRDRHSSAIINIFNQIVQAVEYVHMQGLIHRDLKVSCSYYSMIKIP